MHYNNGFIVDKTVFKNPTYNSCCSTWGNVIMFVSPNMNFNRRKNISKDEQKKQSILTNAQEDTDSNIR